MQQKVRLVLAGAHTMAREGIRQLLEAEADLTVIAEAGDVDETVRLALDLRPDVLVIDLPASHGGTLGTLARLAAVLSPTRYVLLADEPDEIETTVERLNVGGVLPKTASMRELITAVRAVHRGERYVNSISARAGARGVRGQMHEVPTKRELQVLRLVVEGHSNREIAFQLSIAERTVRFHLGHAFAKLGARSRTEAVYLARQRRWVD